jgi:putative holliday junction resolvase
VTKVLGVDYGAVRVGLAVSDPDRKFAFPLEVRQRRARDEDAAFFRDLIEREEIAAVVVGLPVHLDGRESKESEQARAYAVWLAEVTGLRVSHYDERFTSVQAESALWDAGLTHGKRKQRRDKVAAQMMLQAYLDAGCPPDAPPGALGGPAEE